MCKVLWSENVKEITHMGDLGVDGGSIILKWIIGCQDGRWVEFSQDHVKWRALLLAVLNNRSFCPALLKAHSTSPLW